MRRIESPDVIRKKAEDILSRPYYIRPDNAKDLLSCSKKSEEGQVSCAPKKGSGKGCTGKSAPSVGLPHLRYGSGDMVWVIFLSALIFLIYLLIRKYAKKGARPLAALKKARAADDLPEGDSLTLYKRALDLAVEGNFQEAIRYLLAAAVSSLQKSGALALKGSDTYRQIAAGMRQEGDTKTSMKFLINLFEEKWYGGRGCNEEEYSAALNCYSTIMRPAKETSQTSSLRKQGSSQSNCTGFPLSRE